MVRAYGACSLLRGGVGDSGRIYAGVDARIGQCAAVATVSGVSPFRNEPVSRATRIVFVPAGLTDGLCPTVVDAVDDHVETL